MDIKIVNWPGFNIYGSGFQSHTYFYVNFLRNTEQIIVLKEIDTNYKEIIRVNCIEFAYQSEFEHVILDGMSKMKTLKITVKCNKPSIGTLI